MILSNRAIFQALDDGRIVIEPEPQPRLQLPGGERSPFATTSVDLTLGPHLQVPRENLQLAFDLRRPGTIAETLTSISESIVIDERQGYRLAPQEFVLARTRERIHLRLPTDFPQSAAGKPAIAARIEGKSSHARVGLLVHFTAPTVHAGFEGPLTLEIICLGRIPVTLYPGMPICQLIFEYVDGDPVEVESQFHGQDTPAGLSDA